MSLASKALAVRALDSHRFSIDLSDDWCIGSVPHGGYVASCFMSVTQAFFEATKPEQPDVLALHLEFLRRTSAGPAIFIIQEKKLGAQTSVVNVSLVQDGDREEVVGYITHANLSKLAGLSLNTKWTLSPPNVYPVDLSRLNSHGEDTHWIRSVGLFPKFRKALAKYDIFVPRAGRQVKSVVDEWLRLRTGERFTNTMIGSVCDTFPLMAEGFMDDIRQQMGLKMNEDVPPFWYPTLLLNLEVKKSLPAEGVDWLFVRVRAKKIQNGRNDLDIVILDEFGDLVAVSHHVAMIVDASRNLAKRSNRL